MSDLDSVDSAEISPDFGVSLGIDPSTLPVNRPSFRIREPSTKGVGRRGRRGGLGRGHRGVKRGPRKAIEPTEEFKVTHSQATMAFIEHQYHEAERLTLRAIQINPEMYPAHNLLSQIYAAKGDEDKAISAAWAAAHTKHRDPGIWSRIANVILSRNTNDRDSNLRSAIYCVNRVISLDTHNVEARYQRASLYHELGHNGKAASEYEKILKRLPHDTTILRDLAETSIELEKPERALAHYTTSIMQFRHDEPDSVTSFTWSDVNIVTELYGFQGQYDEGIKQLKSLSRWLLGRSRDSYWETFTEDDREWDLEDEPRRKELPGFVSGKYDTDSYGSGLPMELRVKMGVFRLKARSPNLEEAIVSPRSTHDSTLTESRIEPL